MNKKVLFLSTLALTGALFVGCGEALLNETYVEDAGDLLVYARASTGEVLTTAKVTLLQVDNAPRAVDAAGNVTYSGLPIGNNYTVRVEAAGYATMFCQANITAQIADNVLNAQNYVLRAELKKTGASVKGSVFYNDPKTPTKVNTLPATGANLELRLVEPVNNCYYEKKDFTAQVGADGSYVFEGLPEQASFTLYGHPAVLSGVSYEGFPSFNSTTELVGTVKTMPPATDYGAVADPVSFRIISSPSIIASSRTEITDNKVIFVFSKPVNTGIINMATFVTIGNVGIKTEWSTDKKTLTIQPINGTFTAAEDYTVYMQIAQLKSSEASESLSGSASNFYFTIPNTVDLRTKTANKPSLSGNPNLLNVPNVPLIWTATEGATYYEVYYKRNTDSHFNLIGDLLASSACNTTGSCSYSTSNSFYSDAGATSQEFFIIAKDSRNISIPSEILSLPRPPS